VGKVVTIGGALLVITIAVGGEVSNVGRATVDLAALDGRDVRKSTVEVKVLVGLFVRGIWVSKEPDTVS